MKAQIKAYIRGYNTSGNQTFGYIADATVKISDGTIRVISGTSRKSIGEAIKNMWEDWKVMSQEDFGEFIFVRNDGQNFYS